MKNEDYKVKIKENHLYKWMPLSSLGQTLMEN